MDDDPAPLDEVVEDKGVTDVIVGLRVAEEEEREGLDIVGSSPEALVTVTDRRVTTHPIAGTRWAAYNAVTEYVDHHRRARSEDHRREAAWFGQGAQFKQRAWDELIQLTA